MLSDLFSVVGAGALGTSLCRALIEKGFQLDRLISRDETKGTRLVSQMGMGTWRPEPVWENIRPQTVFIAVPDDQIESVANQMRQLNAGSNWDGVTVLHTSGVHNKSVLESLENEGAAIGSFHPLQSFLGHESAAAFRGITVGIEGDEEVLAVANSYVNALVAQSVTVPSDKKALYHSAAVLAGNAATSLMAISEEVWTAALGSHADFREAMSPLIQTSIQNALSVSPSKGLTGPVARGDSRSIEAHLQAIHDHIPQLTSVYGVLTTETIHLATRSGKISPEKAVELLDIIHDHLSRQGIQD